MPLGERTTVERGLDEALVIARRAMAEFARVLGDLRKEIAGATDRLGTVAGETRRPAIKKLSSEDVFDRLSEFERTHKATTGERLSSDEFYARFVTGEFDDRFGARWATFYEA